mgnify:CR=1 FL=1
MKLRASLVERPRWRRPRKGAWIEIMSMLR